jgi:hypothetical protein
MNPDAFLAMGGPLDELIAASSDPSWPQHEPTAKP